MNLDTRARRAADGVRASASGVDPVAQFTELKHEVTTRRRTNRALAVVSAVFVLAGAGWFAAGQMGGDPDSMPASPIPTPSVSAFLREGSLEPGITVGSQLQLPLVAQAPKTWHVRADDDHMVWLESDNKDAPATQSGAGNFFPSWKGRATVYIVGPIVDVIDPDDNVAVGVPADGYADWLRQHPALRVVDDSTVSIDGRQFPQLTIKAHDDSGRVLLDAQGGNEETPLYSEVPKAAVLIETVIEVDGTTMVVRAVGGDSADEQAELRAGLDLVLSTMKLPT